MKQQQYIGPTNDYIQTDHLHMNVLVVLVGMWKQMHDKTIPS